MASIEVKNGPTEAEGTTFLLAAKWEVEFGRIISCDANLNLVWLGFHLKFFSMPEPTFLHTIQRSPDHHVPKRPKIWSSLQKRKDM